MAINAFNGEIHHSPDAVREALDLPHDIPVVTTDARDRERTKETLLVLVEHALLRAQS